MELVFDKANQLAGIDRIIKFNGNRWTFDDKYRRNDYGDILIEYESSEGRVGWVKKDMKCTGITYLIPKTNKVHFINFKALRESWSMNERRYMSFPHKHADNGRYVTKSVAVPVAELQSMLGGWLITKRVPLQQGPTQ